MRKGVGITTSIMFSGGYFAYLAEDGRTLGGLGWLLTGFIGYWIGAGLVAVFESMRSSGPQSPLARAPETKTKTSQTPARRPAMPQRGSNQDPRASRTSGSSSKRPTETKPGAVQRDPVGVFPQQRIGDGSESDDLWIEKLERLSALRRDGFLTEEEFNSQKRMLLPNPGRVETGRTDRPAEERKADSSTRSEATLEPDQKQTGPVSQAAKKANAAPIEKRVSRAELSKYQKLWCAVDGCYSRKTPHGDYCPTHRANRPMQAAPKSTARAVPAERTDEQDSPPVEQFRQRWCIVDGCYQRKAVGDYCRAHEFG